MTDAPNAQTLAPRAAAKVQIRSGPGACAAREPTAGRRRARSPAPGRSAKGPLSLSEGVIGEKPRQFEGHVLDALGGFFDQNLEATPQGVKHAADKVFGG